MLPPSLKDYKDRRSTAFLKLDKRGENGMKCGKKHSLFEHVLNSPTSAKIIRISVRLNGFYRVPSTPYKVVLRQTVRLCTMVTVE